MIKNTEEITIPKDLKEFLNDIVDEKHGFKLGKPWKFSESSLMVAVPILRNKAPKRHYTTMYEVLNDLNIKDTGSINVVELQNKTGKAIFIRAGTIFEGETQNRATQHSGIYNPGIINIDVRCVQQTHGIRSGEDMKFGAIAPLTITYNLMCGNQSNVWESVMNYTSGTNTSTEYGTNFRYDPFITTSSKTLGYYDYSGTSGWSEADYHVRPNRSSTTNDNICYASNSTTNSCFLTTLDGFHANIGGDDLLGYLKNEGKKSLDEALQTIPLFEDQTGVIVFNALGVIALETFDSSKSWKAIKNEIIEKYGDKTKDEEAEHLFDLNENKIVPLIKKFIQKLDEFTERVIRKDELSETRVVNGKGITGEYTLVKGRTIHALLVKE